MKQLLLLLVCTVLFSFSLFGQTDTVTILHLNDTHSNLAPIGPRDASLKGSLGGIARAVTLIGMERMADPKALLLHAGDFSIGDLFYNKYFGVPELRILASIGCDAMALGNHEFDLTPSTLTTALDSGFVAGGFPVLSANLWLGAAGVESLKKYVTNYTIKQVGNVKVGIFGLISPATNVISQPAPAVVDSDFITTGTVIVDSLVNQGCKMIICLSHLGFSYDQMLAHYVPGIHVIVGGHDHLAMKQAQPVEGPYGDTTWIVQANAFYLDLGKVRMTVSGGKARLLDYTLMPITDAIPEEPATKAAVDGMIADIESTWGVPFYSAKVADVTSYFEEVADSLTYEGYHDTPIGNLVTDAFRATTGTQIALEVGGSTAEPLYPGPIVPGDIFRVVGYGFNTVNGLGYRLVTFKMTLEWLYWGLEYGLSTIEQDDEFLVQASGLQYSYNSQKQPFARVNWILVDGKTISLSDTITVTANEFVPLFLDELGVQYTDLHICGNTTEFSALAGYIQQMGTLTPSTEGRLLNDFHYSDAISPREGEAIPKIYRLDQNYPNPFNPVTIIHYTIAGAGDRGSGVSNTRLIVCDLLGREVATLVNEPKAPGSYQIIFDASGLATGVYLYRLSSGSFSAVKKMLLVK